MDVFISYEKLRMKLRTSDIVNMAHLGPRAFEEIGGEVVQTTTFVYRDTHIVGYKSVYCRLVEPTTQDSKKSLFLSGREHYSVARERFECIGGSPFAYWASERALSNFEIAKHLLSILVLVLDRIQAIMSVSYVFGKKQRYKKLLLALSMMNLQLRVINGFHIIKVEVSDVGTEILIELLIGKMMVKK